MRWLLRLSRIARNPPSERMFWLGVAVVVLCLAIFLADRLEMWPDWARAEQLRRR